MSVNERRDEIMRILLGVRQTTIPRLAEALGVSASTVKRDILALTVEEGFPIDTAQGNSGGVILKDFRHPHLHILSREQIAVLQMLSQNSDEYIASVLIGILRAYA